MEQYHYRSSRTEITTDYGLERLRLIFYGSSSISTRAIRDVPAYNSSREALWTEVQSLLYKGAIEEIPLGIRGGGGITPFTSSKKTGGFSSHLKSGGTQCLPPCGQVQNGNLGIDSSRSAARYLDDLSGFEGRLPSRSYHSTAQQVYEIPVQRSTRDPPCLPMGGPPVWVGIRSQGIYQDIGPYFGPFTSQEYVYVPVHRRHLPRADIQGIGYPDSRRQCTSPSPARICDQPSQILPYPVPGDDALRRLDRHPKRPGKAIPEQSSGDQLGVC